ncbi:HNH endonuclease [Streptomyces europaeiscabiei]|uniref:HNH endonuclease n=1 Tax=Streptomyces europaeiscabiei TaxID=146819 RepID=UPI0038D4E9B7
MLHKHHFEYRRNGGSDGRKNLRLVHADCRRQLHAADDRRSQMQGTVTPLGLA